MLSCWQETPESRPLFDALAEKFSKILGTDVTDHYTALNEPYLRENQNRFKSTTNYAKLLSSTNVTDGQPPSQPESISKNPDP